MGNPTVHIIQCGRLFFFTTPPPPDALALNMSTNRDIGTEVFYSSAPAYIALLVTWMPMSRAVTLGDKNDAIKAAIQFAWDTLYHHGIVESAEMPTWINGDPRLMMLDRTMLSPHQADVVILGPEAAQRNLEAAVVDAD